MRQKTFLALAGFLALLISSALAIATPVPSHPISNEKASSNGEYVIHVFQDGQWTKAGSLAFDRFFRKKDLDLGAYLSDGNAAKIRLVQTGGGAAHIDSVFLGDMPPTEIKGIENELALKKVSKRDFDVIDAFEKDIELCFPAKVNDKNLSIAARVEAKVISKVPFQFPAENLFQNIDENSCFYTYRLSSKEKNPTGSNEPFFNEYCFTGSGHPPGYTYGWVSNDEDNLYVKIDFTPDNTMDGDKDYAKVYANTEAGIKEFKVSVPETRWGEPDFTYTDKTSYQHKVYEFVIPIDELGLNDIEKGEEIKLAFAAYGTAAPTVYYVDHSRLDDTGNGLTWANAKKTIQAGLDVCWDGGYGGGEVWVKTGTYNESITLKDGVYLYGGFAGTETQRDHRDWESNVTTIDGQGSVYHVVTGENNATIDGFTITGGKADGAGDNLLGAGMFNNSVSPTVSNCVFSDNQAGSGGGIANKNGSAPSITNCAFTNNSSTGGGSGGGIYNNSSSPTITGCTITSNSTGMSGGGMFNYSSSPIVDKCIFKNNAALGGGGGGMYNEMSSSPAVKSCLFTSNSASARGGGIANYNASSATILNCTFFKNSAAFGGAITNYQGSPFTMSNCILWDNTATTSGDQIYNYGSTTNLTISYSNIKGGYDGSGVFSEAEASVINGGGNIDSDPSFFLGNFHIQPGSPCIDAGTSESAPTNDIDGDTRYDDPYTTNTGYGGYGGEDYYDIGADEYTTPSEVLTQVNIDGFGDSANQGISAIAAYNSKLHAGTFNLSTGAEVLRYDGATNWTHVNTDGFGDSANQGVFSMAVFNGSLYAGTYNLTQGAEVWEYDGANWSQVNINNLFNSAIYSMAAYNSSLYAGTFNLSTGAEVLRYDGATNWTHVNTDGFGDSANQGVFSMAVFNGSLYAGTSNDTTGAEVWEYDGANWSQVTPGWTNNTIASSMTVFNNKLYIGTTNDTTGAEVWEYDGANWAQVNNDGFGDTYNSAVATMAVYGNNLYVGTNNETTGAEVWEYDGANWAQVNNDGFGDVYNSAAFCMGMYNSLLYVGTSNATTGGEVWEYIYHGGDSDGDSMHDAWENAYFGGLSHDSTADGDSDGLTDLQEYQNSTDPNDPDSDDDGFYDGEEVNMGSYPTDDSNYPSYSPGTYYVNISSGNNLTGDGSSDNPWKTLHHTLYRVNKGESAEPYIVNVALGTYSVAGGEGESDEALTITKDNVSIIGETGSMPVLDGAGASYWYEGIRIEASNVTIKNLAVSNFSCYGIYLCSGTANIIEGCEVYENYYGIVIAYASSGNMIRNGCKVYHNSYAGVLIEESSGNEIHDNQNSIYDNGQDGGYGGGVGIEISGSGAVNNLIYNNDIYSTGGSNPQETGIALYYAGPGNQIYKNKIHGHKESGEYVTCGIYVVDSSPDIMQNEIYDNYPSGISVVNYEAEASPNIWNNLIYGTTETTEYGIYLYSEIAMTLNPTIYHNTIDGGYYDGIYIEEGYEGDADPDIKFNIITNFDRYGINNSGGNPIIEYNNVYGNGVNPYGGDTSDQTGINGNISEDPLYFGEGNYYFQSGSPCIDAIPTTIIDPVTVDLEGNSRPKGSGYDMGAYEYVPQYDLTVTTVGQGNVTLDPAGGTYDEGTVVTLTAAADSGWVFSWWSGDLTGTTNPETVTMDSNKSITATFVASDSDGDGMIDVWENTYGLDPSDDSDASGDLDNDGSSNLEEFNNGTDPTDTDSDNDGYYDGEEVGMGTDPADDADYPSYSPGTYYVNISSGNDLTGNGTSDTPWKTLHHSLYRVNGGAAGSYIVNLALGTYSVANSEANDSLTITQDNVTIIGESGSSPVLDGTDASMWGYGIGIDRDADIVRIYNLEIANFLTAGLIIEGTSASVKNCNIHDNGTGLWIESTASSATIKDNQIHKNGTGYYSIGVWVRGASGVTVARNQIYTHEYYGIGVENCSPAIQRNEIYGNEWSGIDIWAYTQEASPQITNNLIYAGASGITMSAMDKSASPGIYHNTIDDGTEDGIYCHGTGATPDIKYNTITNFTGYGINNTGGSPTIAYNDVYGNTTDQYGGDTTDQTGTNGNISQDPLYGSYELQSGSPCIDAIPADSGDPVTVDYAGYARPKGSGFDIGAYEFIADIAHDFALPGGTGEATDYQMFTVPVTLASGSSLKESMENALGTYDKGIWRVFAWDPGSSAYVEMDDPSFADFEVYPGRGFWVISTSTDTITFSGQPAPDGDYTEVPLSPGWNMVALPWPATSIELDKIAVSDGPNSYWITSTNNTLTQLYVWDYTGTGANNGYEQRASGATLQPGTAYWIKVLASTAMTMLVPKDNEEGHFTASSVRAASEATTTPASTEQPPPPPGLSVSFDSTSSDGRTTVSGSGGCFIETAACDSKIQLPLLPIISLGAILFFISLGFKGVFQAVLSLVLGSITMIYGGKKRRCH